VLWNGPVLELHARSVARLGPDILADPPDLDRMLANLRLEDQRREAGDALLDQRLVAGIGNKWKAEALWHTQLSPWRRLADTSDDELRAALVAAAGLMRRSLEGIRGRNNVYRLVGRACPRCGERIRSGGQGDANRIAYWCPGCQV
jgi:endonuclease-8